ncbi:DUF3466 family protein [Geobacter hydrogenophilus]|nr:PEP-CTERM sorting domain-containing protein [Geobacter hydrogenophilus]MBT0895518.1 DUF3466 family protein [Geobacter hydrogenophilus]
MIKRIAQAIMVMTALLFSATSVLATDLYSVTGLGTLGGPYSEGFGINNSGQITGTSYTRNAYFPYHAFLYSGGSMQDLGPPGWYSEGYDINDSGQVTGVSHFVGNGDHAFLYSGGSMQDLGTIAGTYSVGLGINNSGQVTGYSNSNIYVGREAVFFMHAFLYSDGSMQDLGTLGGTFSAGYDINDSGQVTGHSYTKDGDHAFLYSDGSMRDLGTLGGTYSVGLGINNSGQVTGYSYTSNAYFAYHAFLYSGGSMKDLGTLGGTSSEGIGINDSGQVTGYSETSGDTATHAFLYDDDSMVDLNSLISDPSWVLTSATDINDVGQIVGYGDHTLSSGVVRQEAFLLTPVAAVPEPSAFFLLAAGLGGLALIRRKAVFRGQYTKLKKGSSNGRPFVRTSRYFSAPPVPPRYP